MRADASKDADAEDTFESSCLDEISVSTAGLLVMLARMGFNDSRHGGCKEIEPGFPPIPEDYTFALVLDPNWTCRWPRPAHVFTDGHVDIVVEAGGVTIDLSDLLRKSLGEGKHRVAHVWIKELKEKMTTTCKSALLNGGVVPMLGLLEARASLTKGHLVFCLVVGRYVGRQVCR